MGIKLRLVEPGKAPWEPGDMFPMDCKKHSTDGRCLMCDWDGCDGKHYMIVLPNGEHWIMGRRASNCGRKDDHTHRCWVVHGESPNITIDKNGDTCSAGAGSILCAGWHGFIRNGELVEC